MKRTTLMALVIALSVAVAAPAAFAQGRATLDDYVTRYGQPSGYWHDTPGITRIMFKPEPTITMALHVDAETLEPIGEEVWGIGVDIPAKYRFRVDLKGAQHQLRKNGRFNSVFSADHIYTLKDGAVVTIEDGWGKMLWQYPGYKSHVRPAGWEPTPRPLPSILQQFERHDE
jgi:hypothetical protein